MCNDNALTCLRNRPFLQILSEPQLDAIFEAALHVLERVGGRFHDPDARRLLKDSGAREHDGDRVLIPSSLVRGALKTAPDRIVIRDRNQKERLFLEGWNVHFGPGSDTPFTLDPDTGQRRPSGIRDVARAARVTDALPELDFCMSFGLAADVPEPTSDVYHFAAMVKNTEKPLIVTAWNLANLKTLHRIMEMVAGGGERLRENPFAVVFLMAISPLQFPADSLQKLMYCAEHRIPCIWTSGCPTAGATSPIFPAGSAVVALAEFLAGLTLSQLVNPGAPVIVGSAFGSLDMATGLRPYASPEQDLGHLAQAEIARYLRLPSWGNGGSTDANTLDAQAAAEAGRKLVLSALAGNNLVRRPGVSGRRHDLFPGAAGRLPRNGGSGPPVCRGDTRVPGNAGDPGHRRGGARRPLPDPRDTRDHHRRQIWRPELFTRKGHDAWLADGAEDTWRRARAKVRRIIKDHRPRPLDPKLEGQIDAVLAKCGRD